MNPSFERLIERAEALINRIEAILPQPISAPAWNASIAYRYRKRSSGHGLLEPLLYDPLPSLAAPLVKWSVEVTQLQDLPRIMRRANRRLFMRVIAASTSA